MNAPHELRWARIVGTHQVGFHDQRGKARNKPTLGKREANATPPEFQAELIRLAVSSALPNASAMAPATLDSDFKKDAVAG